MNTNVSLQTLVVLEFGEKCSPEAIKWVLTKITTPRDKGGAKLLARTALNENDKVCPKFAKSNLM